MKIMTSHIIARGRIEHSLSSDDWNMPQERQVPYWSDIVPLTRNSTNKSNLKEAHIKQSTSQDV